SYLSDPVGIGVGDIEVSFVISNQSLGIRQRSLDRQSAVSQRRLRESTSCGDRGVKRPSTCYEGHKARDGVNLVDAIVGGVAEIKVAARGHPCAPRGSNPLGSGCVADRKSVV